MAYDFSSMQLYVSQIIKDRETAEIEFKSAKGGFPKSFWETYSAFANTHGGTIVLGVKEKDGIFTLNNLTDDDIDKLQKDFWSGVHNKNTINACILKNDDVEVGEIEGHKVILFHIPQAQRDQRPIHCTQDAFNGTFRRNYEGDYLCGNAEVRRMFADADITRPADGRILKNYSWDDIDMSSFEQYRRLFATAKPSHPWHTLSNDELMRKLGGYRKDRETGEEGFTLAGILMFGKYDSIKDQTCAPKFFPDYKEIPADTSSTRWIDRIYPDGSWEANLFQFYRRVLPKLQQVIPTPFRLEGIQRKDETPAHESLREAFANLCVHADYSEESSLLVYRYPHRIVFSNPGVMLISKQQFYQGGESVCRNTSLQQMFMMIGSAEKAGSGVDKILKGWETLNWKRPYPIEKAQPNKVELVMPLESLLDESVLLELNKLFGIRLEQLDSNEKIAVSMALTERIINNERLRDTLSLHPADITHMLQHLCKEDFLASSGHGRGTVYKLKVATLGEKVATSEGKVATPKGSWVATPKGSWVATPKGSWVVTPMGSKVATSGEKVATSKGKVATPNSKRMSKDDMRKMIIDYCSEWRTVSEIADYVCRNKQYIRNKILPVMHDVLQMLFPKENHPGQKYKVRD